MISIVWIQNRRLESVCCFVEVRFGNYFGGEPVNRTEVEAIVKKLKNGKTSE